MAIKFTDKFLGGEMGGSKNALPPEGKSTVDHYDNVAPGLGIRFGQSRRGTFFVHYRLKGVRRRDILKPRYPELSLTEARDEARETQRDLAGGRDPRVRRNPPEPEPEDCSAPETYKEAVKDYIKREVIGRKQNVTWEESERILLKEGQSWLSKQLSEIDDRDIRRVLDAIRDGTTEREAAGYMANRTYSALQTFFAWCATPGIRIIEKSPMAGMKKPWLGEIKRDRHYNDQEIARLWKAASKMTDVQGAPIINVQGALLKLLILTGKRKMTMAALRWDEISDSGFWQPPKDLRQNKSNKRKHAIPLPKLALRIIKSLPKVEKNPYVFVGLKEGDHLKPLQRMQRTIQAKSGISDFRYHDLRHTAETATARGWPTGRMKSNGKPEMYRVSRDIRDLLFDHVPQRGSGDVYDHHEYKDEMAEALEAWAGRIEVILREHDVWPSDSSVTPLRG